MLQHYISPVTQAFLTFPFAAMLFTLPFLIVQYRRHGYINKWRGFLLYLFLLYLMNAFFLVLLPMPPTRHNEPPQQVMQLIPFIFIQDILRETNVDFSKPSQYINLLRERAVLQNLFNVMLTIPFGMFMRYYFRLRWFSCLAAAFALSLFFEVTQVTGIYGYFDHPYRLFDIDDIMTNTLGGMVGYLIAQVLSVKLPRMDRLDDSLDLSAKRVSYTRRLLAFGIDGLLMLPVMLIFGVVFHPVIGLLMVVAYHSLVPYWTNGRTVGRAIVRIELQGKGERLRLGEVALRQSLLYGFLGWNVLVAPLPPSPLSLIFNVATLVLNIAVFIHAMRCLFNHQLQLWHEKLSGTRYRITGARQPASQPPPANGEI
ncbi:VanZ family protein [Paenibacillus daejeonensis]|uniref:VanZ family protein n=1 Tax=Paenibacillus daejeonensis TaxID=135193 RepID=UPI00036A2E13|nr:VanZ family protein [Paenibacillus daejeonensis]